LPNDLQKSVTVVGAGIAGMSAACALADAGFRVQLVDRRGYLGGRASSYLHPGVGEVIDNCQHVLFGCCTNLIGFYRRIGSSDRIHWTSKMTMIEPGGRQSQLKSSQLPAPLHGLPSFLAAHAFSLQDKLSLARAFQALLRPVPSDSTENLGAWLQRHGQSRGALERFWQLVIASALNASIESIAMPYAAKVIRELFMNSAEAGSMGMSTVPLSKLYDPAIAYLADHGGCTLLQTFVEGAAWDKEHEQWIIRTRKGELTSDYLVVALPFEGMQQLLPNMPATDNTPKLADQILRHQHSPICSVHLWFDREITELEHAVLLNRNIHWLYNQSRLQHRQGVHYVELVISASKSFAELKREETIALALHELAEFFPRVKDSQLQKAALVKEVHATFCVTPGIDAARPAAQSPWPNCFLAGDWTATGWPSTMESAARSGHLAAEALCRSAGMSRNFLDADLKPKGLMRFVK
jgi:squalene-associated FAD-dependent desaturase